MHVQKPCFWLLQSNEKPDFCLACDTLDMHTQFFVAFLVHVKSHMAMKGMFKSHVARNECSKATWIEMDVQKPHG